MTVLNTQLNSAMSKAEIGDWVSALLQDMFELDPAAITPEANLSRSSHEFRFKAASSAIFMIAASESA